MKSWLSGKTIALLAFLMIAALVTGGLGWVTYEVLWLEQERFDDRAQDEFDSRLQLALWRLDSRVSPVLIKEDGRPYNHYSAFYAPPQVFRTDGTAIRAGTVIEPSPLLSADLPDWVKLHFHVGSEMGWLSPQVLEQPLKQLLKDNEMQAALDNVTPQRGEILGNIQKNCTPQTLFANCQKYGLAWSMNDQAFQPLNPNLPAQPQAGPGRQGQVAANPSLPQGQNQDDQNFPANYAQIIPQLDMNKTNAKEFMSRMVQQSKLKQEGQNRRQVVDLARAEMNLYYNGENWFRRNSSRPVRSQLTTVHLSPMVPMWLALNNQPEQLVVARLVQIGENQYCQGFVLDWQRLQSLLADEVKDLFPNVGIKPMREFDPPHPERIMTTLPVQIDPGPVEPHAVPLWTPLRAGLGLSWLAALFALTAVGLGGWSLLALAERRIRFVSAVTHELRTPLTTQRLYLDMLTSGMVTGEQQKAEYLETLHGETERLNRLVGNVLDFSRLERQRPQLEMSTLPPAEILDQVHANWDGRCQGADKELVVVNELPEDVKVKTDVKLVQQILGNLIDNACKYSQGAEDRRVWLRAKIQKNRLVFEVEDRGPGVPLGERRSIFRAFRRGHSSETTGGVGLGLALGRRWASLIAARLSFGNCTESKGACFKLELSSIERQATKQAPSLTSAPESTSSNSTSIQTQAPEADTP